MTQEIVISGGEDARPITEWNPASGTPLPAYLAEAMDDLGDNIPDRTTVPSLSYEGKTWQIVKDGNKNKLQATNSDGDLVPVPIMRVIVLDFNADRGRSYYEGAYDPSKTASPKCWSRDGKEPDASIPLANRQASACNGCPQSIKGSKIADGKEMVACAAHRMLAVVPAFDISSDPLRLKIAVTSDYDKEITEHGWFAFRQYVDYLKQNGIGNTGLVVTKIKFDVGVQYPKLLFALDRVLQPHEIAMVKQQKLNPKVAELLAEKWTAAGSAGTLTNDSDIRPHGLEGAYADGWQAHPDAAGYSYKGQEVLANADLAARYPAPAPKPVAPPPPPVETPAAAPNPLAAALADGWLIHPDAAGYYYKGTDVLAEADLAARYVQPDPTPAAPAAPAIPAAPVVPQKTPRELAIEDGWVQHPDSPPHGYKGAEVLEWAAIEGRYAGNAASVGTAASSGPAATQAGGSATSDNGQAAQTSASPIDPVAADPALAQLLSQWTSG